MRLGVAAIVLPLALTACPGVLGKPTIACKRDADCAPPACGPCTSGAPLVDDGVACAVNPCPAIQVVCSAEKKICVVK